MAELPTIGRIGLYRTDGRNGLSYDLPAIVTVTRDTHPGDYPSGDRNALPVPDEGHVHITVFTPGGFGTKVQTRHPATHSDYDYVDADELIPGSGSYVEWNVPVVDEAETRSWRWSR